MDPFLYIPYLVISQSVQTKEHLTSKKSISEQFTRHSCKALQKEGMTFRNKTTFNFLWRNNVRKSSWTYCQDTRVQNETNTKNTRRFGALNTKQNV